MNKIITINLGGIAIQIEEDAYDVLRDYLKSLELHFEGTENGEEILVDIESRIAEMLYERLKVGKVSINKSDINEVSVAMGNPSELETDEEEEPTKENKSTSTKQKKIKRLFRDMEDRKVGGVCSGIAKYFDIDVTIVRIIWLAMIFIFGTGFVVYFLLWAILPEAKTAAEKLEMMGEVPNVENIKNTIRDEAAQAYKRIKDTAESSSVQNFFDKLIGLLVTVIKAFAKVFAIVIMVGVLIAIFGFFLRFFSGGQWFNMNSNLRFHPQDFNASLVGTGTYWLIKISLFLAVVIPLLYLLVRILLSMLGVQKPNKLVKQGVLSIWLCTILFSIGGMVYGANLIKADTIDISKKEIVMIGDTLNIAVSDFKNDGLIEFDRLVQLDVIQNNDGQAFIEIYKSVRGRDEQDAQNGISAIEDAIRISGNKVLFNEKILSTKNPKAKLPFVKYTIHIPEGKYVVFNSNTRSAIHHIDNKQNIYDPEMAGKTFLMTSSGLSCVDCNEQEYHESTPSNQSQDYIEHIDISDAVRVEIIEDGTNRIEYPKEKKWRESLDIELKSNKLSIHTKDEFGSILNWFSGDDDLKIIIHSSGLKSLEVDGSSSVVYTANSSQTKEYFSLEASGANKITINNLNAFKTSADIEGTNKIELSGKVNILLIEADGANAFQAYDFEAENVNVDVNGAAICNVFAKKEITGKVDGASSLTYKGNPELSVKSRGMSMVRAKD